MLKRSNELSERTILDSYDCNGVTALSETIRLMAEIDAAIPKWPTE